MKFYDREIEQKELVSIERLSRTSSEMTIVMGRRRVGKTSLLKKTFEKKKHVYFFVARKDEHLLCKEYCEEIEQSLGVRFFGEPNSFKDVFAFLLNLAKTMPFTLIIDEFQEFASVNPSVYSDMQNLWDSNKDKAKLNLILCGSIYSLMKKLFEDRKEPLFARQTQTLIINEFSNATLKEILRDHNPRYTKEDLLAFYLFTGGMAKYVEAFVQAGALTKDKMLAHIFKPGSFFIDEGRNVLIDEFGKDYRIYFSILSLIASSKTSRPEIESVLGGSVGGYLERLEKDYSLVQKIIPVCAKVNSRHIKYRICDNFLSFWFRFVYKYASAIEIGNFDYVRKIVLRDYDLYSGLFLEKYFRRELIASKKYNIVGNYWEKGNQNEIDIVAVNEFQKKVRIAEVKRNKDRINLNVLKEKAKNLVEKFNGFKVEYKAFSIDDMD